MHFQLRHSTLIYMLQITGPKSSARRILTKVRTKSNAGKQRERAEGDFNLLVIGVECCVCVSEVSVCRCFRCSMIFK